MEKSTNDVIVCLKKLEGGCGFTNFNVSNVIQCVNCGKIIKATKKNNEGEILYFGQKVFFFKEIVRSGVLVSIINGPHDTEVVVRYDEKPWDIKAYDQNLKIHEIYLDVKNIFDGKGVEILPTKRFRKEKKIFDPDLGNLTGDFVGNEIYATNRQRKRKSSDEKQAIEEPNNESEDANNIGDNGIKMFIESNANSPESMVKVKNPVGRPKKKGAGEELFLNVSKPNETNGTTKKKQGRPRKDNKHLVIEEEEKLEEKIEDNEIVNDGKRKRKKKEFFDVDTLFNSRPRDEKEVKKPKGEGRSSRDEKEVKKSNLILTEALEEDNEDNDPDKIQKERAIEMTTVVFTTKTLDFLLSTYDFQPSLFIKRSFHGRYLEANIKRALLHLLYNWVKPLAAVDPYTYPTRKSEKRLEISIAEIQEILFFCPIDVKEIYSMPLCRRLLSVQMPSDSTVGKDMSDLISTFLLDRSCYDGTLQTFLYPHDSGYLLSSRSAMSTSSIQQLKKMNLKLPLSFATFKIIMKHIRNSRKDIEVKTKAREIIEMTSIGKSGIYLELASNNGMQVLQIAALVGCRCYGVEVNEAAFTASRKLLHEFDMVLEELNISDRLSSIIEFSNSQLFSNETLLSDSTVIYFDNERVSADVLMEFSSALMTFTTKTPKKVVTIKNLEFGIGEQTIDPSRLIKHESGTLGMYYFDKFAFKKFAALGVKQYSNKLIFDVVTEQQQLTPLCDSIDESNNGSRTYTDGTVYRGQFRQGLREGFGTISYPPRNPSQRAEYAGEWRNDRIHGKGKMTWIDGESYEGQWHNEVKHGLGKYSWPTDKTYEGQWANGCMEGNGILYYGKRSDLPGRYSYEGQFSDDMPQGNGVIMFEDGRKYEGAIVGNTMRGPGIITYPVGDIYSSYEGDFSNDNFEGRGFLKYEDGRQYDGFWLCGQKHGEGKFTYAKDDSKKRVQFDGVFYKDRIWQGCMTYSDNCSYDGKWRIDIPHGKGLATFVTTAYDGTWYAGLPHGNGRYFYNDINMTTIKQGAWREGFFIPQNRNPNDSETVDPSNVVPEEFKYFLKKRDQNDEK